MSVHLWVQHFRVDGCRLPSKGFNISTNSRTPRIASREYLRISAENLKKGGTKTHSFPADFLTNPLNNDCACPQNAAPEVLFTAGRCAPTRRQPLGYWESTDFRCWAILGFVHFWVSSHRDSSSGYTQSPKNGLLKTCVYVLCIYIFMSCNVW